MQTIVKPLKCAGCGQVLGTWLAHSELDRQSTALCAPCVIILEEGFKEYFSNDIVNANHCPAKLQIIRKFLLGLGFTVPSRQYTYRLHEAVEQIISVFDEE